MKVQLATILIGLCGATLAAPTHVQQEKRLWPFHFPGEDHESGAEPSLPLPCYPFPTESDDSTGSDFPRFFPRPPFDERCGESPLDSMTEGEDSPLSTISNDGEGLPWQLSGEDEQDESQGLMGGEELGMEEENDIGGDDNDNEI